VTTRRSPETRYRAVLAKRRDGETLVALARRQGVKLRTLYWWHQRFAKRRREQGDAAGDASALTPVECASLDLSAILSPSFEVALQSSGHVVHVPPRFDAVALRRLVEALEA
jgi:transposase-like protein